MLTDTRPTASQMSRSLPVPPRAWGPDIALLLAVVAITLDIWRTGWVAGLDAKISAAADASSSPWGDHVARTLFYLGDGTLLVRAAIVLAVYVTWRRWRASTWDGPRWPVVRALATPGLLVALVWTTYRGVVGAMKLAAGRGAPRSGDLTFAADGMSYPSGHAAASALWYGVLALLLALGHRHRLARGLWAARWPLNLLGVAAMIYLDFHWLSDAVVGLLLGTLVLRALTRVLDRVGEPPGAQAVSAMFQ